jgi:hypothetical protein
MRSEIAVRQQTWLEQQVWVLRNSFTSESVHVKAICSGRSISGIGASELKYQGRDEQVAQPVCTQPERAHPLWTRNVSIADMICIEEHLPNP